MVAIYVSLYNFTLPWGKQLIWFFRHFNPANKKLLQVLSSKMVFLLTFYYQKCERFFPARNLDLLAKCEGTDEFTEHQSEHFVRTGSKILSPTEILK